MDIYHAHNKECSNDNYSLFRFASSFFSGRIGQGAQRVTPNASTRFDLILATDRSARTGSTRRKTTTKHKTQAIKTKTKRILGSYSWNLFMYSSVRHFSLFIRPMDASLGARVGCRIITPSAGCAWSRRKEKRKGRPEGGDCVCG